MYVKHALLVLFLIVVVVLSLGSFWVLKQGRIFDSRVEALNLRVGAVEGGLPDAARYFKVVRLLESASKGKLSASDIVEVSKVILEGCTLYSDLGLTEDIIFGLIQRESGFNPKALSHMKAYGLTQCIRMIFELHLPALGYPIFTEELAYNPVVNVRVGISEMVRLRRLFLEDGVDSWHITLSAYYYGERPIFNLLRSKNNDVVTLEYGKGVMDLAKAWKERGL